MTTCVKVGRQNRRPRSGAFTLIELLVVIAIIALLIAILLPSLEAARRQSKKSACLSHIKNIASSSRVYAADDVDGFGIPVHPLQGEQEASEPTFVGAYEWGGKSGIGWDNYATGSSDAQHLGSKYGTKAGFGPSTRPMNEILYKGGFPDNRYPVFNRQGAVEDTLLDLELFVCPADNGPPRAAHCEDWLLNSERSSYDHFGNSYAANVFMIASSGGGTMKSNSPYMKATSRVPTPARTLYYEENIGRWAWSCKREWCTTIDGLSPGVDPGPTKAIRGWHGQDWTFNRSFLDSHAESQRLYIEGSEDSQGYALHYTSERLSSYPAYPGYSEPGSYEQYQCIIVRGPGWQKDTMPGPLVETWLNHGGGGRPSYENCVENGT